LSFAPEDGIPVADLVTATGMSHRWVNYRLRALADDGQAIQLKRGMWRAATPKVTTRERHHARARATLTRVCTYRHALA